MKRMRIKALFLAAALAFPGAVPATAYATEAGTEASEEGTEEDSLKVAPYMLKTELAKEDNYNEVRVWLELNPANSESVASYQIALQLEGAGDTSQLDRTMELEFDEALNEAQVKETKFDAQTQTLRIYVAGTKNLVQIGSDENGNPVQRLPIGTVKVNVLADKEANKFKIVAGDNAAELITVGMDRQTKNAAEVYGQDDPDFEIPSDGTIYGAPEEYSLGVAVKTLDSDGQEDAENVGGTVSAYLVGETGESEILAEGMVEKDSKVRLAATPAAGYQLMNVTLTDENDKTIELQGDYSFTMTGSIDVTATFQKKQGYTVSVGEGAAIQGAEGASQEMEYRSVVTVVATVPEGKKFSHWVNQDGAIVSYSEKYSFTLLNNVTLTPCFVDSQEAIQEQAMAILNGGEQKETSAGSQKYRLSYTGQVSFPSGYKIVERGIVLTNQQVNADNFEQHKGNFVIGGQINDVNVAKISVGGSTKQFIVNVNNVKPGQTRVARAYLTYRDRSGNEETVYGATCVNLTTPEAQQ